MKKAAASLTSLSVRLLGVHLLGAAVLCGMAAGAGAQATAPGRTFYSTQLGSVNSPWAPGLVEVFATSSMYVGNSERAIVYRVDARKQLMNEINRGGLPPNPQQAAAIVRQRMQALGPDFHRRLQAALMAVEKTMVYGVRRVPAVVVDRQRVVYGVSDVAQAVEIVRRGGGQPIGARFVPGRRASAPAAPAPARPLQRPAAGSAR